MNSNPTLDDVHEALTFLKAHIHEWPTNTQLRENHTPNARRATPPPDALPFGLDRTLDTPQRIRTHSGAITRTHYVWHAWASRLDKPRDNLTNVDDMLTYLTVNLQRSLELPEHVRLDTWRRLTALARECRTVTGHGAQATNYPCPSCRDGRLEQPYSSEGVLELLVCSQCGETWTHQHLVEYARIVARMTRTEMLVTQEEASKILDVKLGTIHARVKRRGLKPVGGRGRGAVYELDSLK